ncbi:hypothetical protein K4L44_06170 [Halosquirtibacter laminarini]|uniref:Uncharacterized protein n=1 Tax=Halosquirtibacter laminarini TaxID=3374600 RepID=A0AC61NRA1_9BACT|nr:hypothetical protein K4L44_06170 [Prolixibacteraceae bacterium]
MKRLSIIISIALGAMLIIPFSIIAQNQNVEFKCKGFVDVYHAVRSSSPHEFMSSRSRVRMEVEATKDNSYLFVSLNSQYNNLLPDQTKIELREAFLQYTTNHIDLKVGRQIVIWGISDAMRITDVVSPLDMTEFLAQDYDDIRMPVNAFKFRYFNSKMSLELLYIPISSFYVVPTDLSNPWSIRTAADRFAVDANLGKYPDKNLENSEYGGRLSFFLSGIDIGLCALHTWNKMPVIECELSASSDTVFMRGKYDRMDMVGGDITFPVGKFVVRGESAIYFDELLQSYSSSDVRRNTLNYLLGIDCYPGSEWTLTAQYSRKYIPNYKPTISLNRSSEMATLGITKNILQSTMKLSNFLYYDMTNKGAFNRFSADYAISDQIHLIIGYDYFDGEEGTFRLYKDNSEFWIKAKFSF